MPKQNPTNADILTAINDFASHTEQRFQGIENRLGTMETKVTRIETTMVTKDYLDGKLADLRGDLVVLVRKEDTKVSALLNLLQAKKLLSPKEVGKIQSMEPFPQLNV